MVEFTKTQLQRLGNLEDKEFSIRKVAGENGHQMDEVVTKQRWFGGRLARHHKIQWGEDRTAKRGEYVQAKLDVLDSLRRIYGTEIGERAFKAHIGRTIDGVHQTSADHPITGRHIQKMLKTAERDLRQQIVLQKFNRDFRDSDGKVMSEHATAAWMMSKSVGLEGPDGQRIPFSPNVTGWIRQFHESGEHQERHDRRIPIDNYHYKLRGDRTTDAITHRPQDAPKGKPVATSLLGTPPYDGEVAQFLKGNPGQKDGFWTLELDLVKSVGGRKNHLIGIHVDRDNPDIINVFDANRVEASIPRGHFEDWLNKHLEGYGEITRTTLYRSEESLFGSLKKLDGSWRWDERLHLEDFEVSRLFDFSKQKLRDGIKQGDGFSEHDVRDINRLKLLIGDGVPPVKLTIQNVEEQLLELVRTDPDHGDDNVEDKNPSDDNSVRVNDDDDVTFFDDEDTTDDAPESKFSQEDRNASKALCWLLTRPSCKTRMGP